MHLECLLAAPGVAAQGYAILHLCLPGVGQQVGVKVVIKRGCSLVHGVAAGPASHGSFVLTFYSEYEL